MKTIELKLSEVVANYATNLRKDYGNEDFQSLKESIRINGIQVPMHVYKGEDKKYHLFDGFRRHKACFELLEEGIMDDKKILFIVNDIDDEATRIVKTLLSNERKNFTAIEESLMIGELVELTGKTQAQVAEMLGKTPAYVSKAMSISKADETVIVAAKSGAISVNDAATLSRQSDKVQKAAVAAINTTPDKKDEIVKAVVKTKAAVTAKPKAPEPNIDDDDTAMPPDDTDDIDIDDAITAAITNAQTQVKPKVEPKPEPVNDTPRVNAVNNSGELGAYVMKVLEAAKSKSNGDVVARVLSMMVNFNRVGADPNKCYESIKDVIDTGF